MTDLLEDLGARVSAIGSNWTKYSVVGSFVLYVFGYLAVRFHLTAIGIGTDLAVLDERYLFGGARFLVYMVSAVPGILLMLAPLALLVWIISLVSGTIRRIADWPHHRPVVVAVIGVVIAVLSIQLVLRQCFLVSDLLLARTLPRDPAWLVALLVNDTWMPLYFDGLILLCVIPLALAVAIRDAPPVGLVSFTRALLVFLVAVEILLLPVNYGILVMDKTMPRVASVASDRPLAEGDRAWLAWEGEDGITYLLRRADGSRALITEPRGDAKHIEIIGFDSIVPALFPPGER